MARTYQLIPRGVALPAWAWAVTIGLLLAALTGLFVDLLTPAQWGSVLTAPCAVGAALVTLFARDWSKAGRRRR